MLIFFGHGDNKIKELDIYFIKKTHKLPKKIRMFGYKYMDTSIILNQDVSIKGVTIDNIRDWYVNWYTYLIRFTFVMSVS